MTVEEGAAVEWSKYHHLELSPDAFAEDIRKLVEGDAAEQDAARLELIGMASDADERMIFDSGVALIPVKVDFKDDWRLQGARAVRDTWLRGCARVGE